VLGVLAQARPFQILVFVAVRAAQAAALDSVSAVTPGFLLALKSVQALLVINQRESAVENFMTSTSNQAIRTNLRPPDARARFPGGE
jgi:hypothetical protein